MIKNDPICGGCGKPHSEHRTFTEEQVAVIGRAERAVGAIIDQLIADPVFGSNDDRYNGLSSTLSSLSARVATRAGRLLLDRIEETEPSMTSREALATAYGSVEESVRDRYLSMVRGMIVTGDAQVPYADDVYRDFAAQQVPSSSIH